MLSSILMMLFCISIGVSQKTILKSTNAQPIDENRYKEVQGSAMYFKDNVKATLIATNGDEIKDVLLNYNGLTKEVEVFLSMENKMLILDERDWSHIEILAKGNEANMPKGSADKIIFKKGVHKRFKGKFAIVLFEGKNFTLAKAWRKVETFHQIQDVGKTIDVKKFQIQKKYLIITGDRSEEIKPKKKKSLLKSLNQSKKLEKFIKSEKLKTSNEKDFVKLMNYYDEIGF